MPGPALPWAAFEAAAPDLAAAARSLLRWSGEDSAFLATVRGAGLPRIHPVNVGVVGDGLYVFILPSTKLLDLDEDGRFAIHAHQDPAVPRELSIRGRAVRVDDEAIRAVVAAAWPFEPDATYALFELRIATVTIGERPTAADWPPRYSTWSAASRPTPG